LHSAFYGSFVDAVIAFPLGALLIFVQIIAARNDLYSNVYVFALTSRPTKLTSRILSFEISIATIASFLAAALAATPYFCYTGMCGALEPEIVAQCTV
jgi:hypothetical protein